MTWTRNAATMVEQVQSAGFPSFQRFLMQETAARPELDLREEAVIKACTDAGHARGVIHNNSWKAGCLLIDHATEQKTFELVGFVVIDDTRGAKAASCLLSMQVLWSLFHDHRILGEIYEDNKNAIQIAHAAGWERVNSTIYQGANGPRTAVTMAPIRGKAVRWSAEHLVKLATSGHFGFEDRLLDWHWDDIEAIARGASKEDF